MSRSRMARVGWSGGKRVTWLNQRTLRIAASWDAGSYCVCFRSALVTRHGHAISLSRSSRGLWCQVRLACLPGSCSGARFLHHTGEPDWQRHCALRAWSLWIRLGVATGVSRGTAGWRLQGLCVCLVLDAVQVFSSDSFHWVDITHKLCCFLLEAGRTSNSCEVVVIECCGSNRHSTSWQASRS